MDFYTTCRGIVNRQMIHVFCRNIEQGEYRVANGTGMGYKYGVVVFIDGAHHAFADAFG